VRTAKSVLHHKIKYANLVNENQLINEEVAKSVCL